MHSTHCTRTTNLSLCSPGHLRGIQGSGGGGEEGALGGLLPSLLRPTLTQSLWSAAPHLWATQHVPSRFEGHRHGFWRLLGLCPARAVTPALSSLSAIAATGTGFRHVWERAGCLRPGSCPLPSLRVVNTGDLGHLPALPLTGSVT